jgi:hypothetical protein
MDNTITMDALTLLREVSDAYRSLRSLSVEASILTKSGDENFSQHSEQRVHFLYAAPDRIRYERFGKNDLSRSPTGRNYILASVGADSQANLVTAVFPPRIYLGYRIYSSRTFLSESPMKCSSIKESNKVCRRRRFCGTRTAAT